MGNGENWIFNNRDLILKIKSNFILFTLLTGSIIIIFSPVYLNNRPFIFMNDQVVEYHALYTEWIRLIRNLLSTGQLPFYSWTKFLGSDFYSSSSFYVNGDIFLPFLLLFKKIETGLIIETLLLIYLSAYLFKLFLIEFGIKKELPLIIVPYAYALNGLVGLYFGNYMFHRFYAFLPLLFLGIERYLNKNKTGAFVLSVSILFLQSFYFMFPTSLFLVIYFTFSYFLKNKHFYFFDYLKKSMKLISYYLIGFGLVSFLMLPTILYSLKTPRLDEVLVYGFTWPLKVWIGMFFSFLSGPFPIYTSIPNIFQSGFDGHEYWYSFFVSSTFFFLILLNLKKIKIKENIPYLLVHFALALFMLFYPINRIFHAFAEPTLRISFLFVFFMLLHTAVIFEKDDTQVRMSNIYFFLIFSGFLFLSLYINHLVDIKIHSSHLLMLFFSVLLGCFSIIILNRSKKWLIVIWVFLEITLNLTISNYYLSMNFYHHKPNLYQEYVDYYQEIDSSLLFRTFVDPRYFKPSSNLNLNQSMIYGYMSTSSYESFYEPSLKKFLNLNGFDWHIIHLDKPEILKLLGVKYYLVADETELPLNISSEFVSKINYLKVYKDINALPIGYTYSKFKNISDVDFSNIDWLNTLLIEDKDFMRLSSISISERAYFNVIEKYTNGLVGKINLNTEQVLFLSIPNNPGWKIFVDDQITQPIQVHGGFIGLKLSSGEHIIRMHFTPIGFKQGVLISVGSFFIWCFILIYKRFKKSVKIEVC